VDIAKAQQQMHKAGMSGGKSGDPHKYNNGDNIDWQNQNCNNKKNILMEYPIYWEQKKSGQQEWRKESISKGQDSTPLRAVWANMNGGFVFCGVMTHKEVTADFQGRGFFQRCMP